MWVAWSHDGYCTGLWIEGFVFKPCVSCVSRTKWLSLPNCINRYSQITCKCLEVILVSHPGGVEIVLLILLKDKCKWPLTRTFTEANNNTCIYMYILVAESRRDYSEWTYHQIQVNWAAKHGHVLGYWCDSCRWLTIQRSWGEYWWIYGESWRNCLQLLFSRKARNKYCKLEQMQICVDCFISLLLLGSPRQS